MKLPVRRQLSPLFVFGALALSGVTPGCAAETSLGMSRTASVAADPPPMCVALRGAETTQASTTEVTAAVAPTRDEGPPTSTTTPSRKAEGATVKDRGALTYLKGS